MVVSELPTVSSDCNGYSCGRVRQSDPFHYGLGHHRLGGVFFRNRIRFHHAEYARTHLLHINPRIAERKETHPYFVISRSSLATVMFFVLHYLFWSWLLQVPRRFMRMRVSTGIPRRARTEARALRLVRAQAATETPAIWKITDLPCRTILAPIFPALAQRSS